MRTGAPDTGVGHREGARRGAESSDAGQGPDPRGELEGAVSGRSEVTPLAVLGGVGVAVAVLFVVALAIVVLAYVLA